MSLRNTDGIQLPHGGAARTRIAVVGGSLHHAGTKTAASILFVFYDCCRLCSFGNELFLRIRRLDVKVNLWNKGNETVFLSLLNVIDR